MREQINYDDVITVPPCGIAGPSGDIQADERIDRVLIPETCLQARIRALAAQICRDYATTQYLYLVVLLKGAFVFAADLGREICRLGGPHLKYDFIKAVTYGMAIKNSTERKREVAIQLKPTRLQGQDVLLVDDIVDQAFTMSKARHVLALENVKSLRTCALLYKVLEDPTPELRKLKTALPLDYVGFRVTDRWVAGYGIDAAEEFRHLPFIVAVDERHYKEDTC